MTYNIGAPVSFGYALNDFMFTYVLDSAITATDVGKAVTLDTSAANKVKLAGNADKIFGRLETFEDRISLGIKVGTVARKFKDKLPKTAAAIAVGDSITGSATAGSVITAVTADPSIVVIEVGTGYVVAEKL